jgi:hypothetical protein
VLAVRRPLVRVVNAEGTAARALAVCGYVALAVGILFVRRPDAVLHPQFWAEDGTVYFADAYNRGLDAVLTPGAGYLVLAPRVAALLGQPLGLAGAPVLFNLIGLAVQLAPALLILSARFGRAIPSPRVRALAGLLYLLVPNPELHATVTNAQWHLALLMCMVVAASPPRGIAWRCFDVAVLTAGGLSGPLVLVVAPLALVRWITSRQGWYGVLGAVASVVALVQLGVIHGAGRTGMALGAGVRSLIRILADRVIVPGLTGSQDAAIFSLHWWHGLLWAALLVLATVALGACAVLRGPAELRVVLAFSAASLTLALLNPLIVLEGPQWPPMVTGEAGQRYFLIPTVGVLVLVLWGLSRLPRLPRAAAGTLLAVLLLAGTAAHPQYPALPDLHPAASAADLAAAAPGTVVEIPLNPAGWSMSLRRH